MTWWFHGTEGGEISRFGEANRKVLMRCVAEGHTTMVAHGRRSHHNGCPKTHHNGGPKGTPQWWPFGKGTSGM
eukprot:2927268-Prymnesium_polylepis.1